MYNFVPTIRTDRFREIREYKEKNYSFIQENRYRLIDTIIIEESKNKYIFEVRVDFNDVKYFIVKDGATIYLSIYQLYQLFEKAKNSIEIDVVYQLKQLLKSKKKEAFCYRGINYEISKIRRFSLTHKISIPDSDIEINFNELLYLLMLIQEKSNYLWSISYKNDKYKNGIIRLIIALLVDRSGHTILSDIGWFLNEDLSCFKPNILKKVDKENKNYKTHNELVERKYYLTERELGSIIKLES